jgi:hypothetical protein
LNVFAAHFDINEKGNKFGFDKVIFVCDIENIRKIFSNRYGQNTDFNGYIDKFYSREIFAFDNWHMITDKLDVIFKEYKFKTPQENSVYNLSNPTYVLDFYLIKHILTELIKVNAINLRSLLKFTKSVFVAEHRDLNFPNEVSIKNHRLHLFNTIDFIYRVLGNKENFLSSLKQITHIKLITPSIGSLIMISNWNHYLLDPKKKTFSTILNNKKYLIEIKDDYKEYTGNILKATTSHNGMQDTNEPQDDFYEALYLAAKTLVDLRILK